MGVSPFSRSGSDNYPRTPMGTVDIAGYVPPKVPEPNARQFDIKKLWYAGGYCIAVVNYPQCTTYNGDKILVYRSSPEHIIKQKLLDPHFLEYVFTPIARFSPTPSLKEGVGMAKVFVQGMLNTTNIKWRRKI